MARLTLSITEEERLAIFALARRERREPRDQVALIVRRELERIGLLPADQEDAPADMPAECEQLPAVPA